MGSDKKTIWILNQYASHLETRHWELSRSFAEQGYNVAVITSSFHHGKREYMYDEKVKFVDSHGDQHLFLRRDGAQILLRDRIRGFLGRGTGTATGKNFEGIY